MTMIETNQKQKFDEVIWELRKQDHAAGHPFMINDTTLAKGQFYYEYPDGRISIEHLIMDGENSHFEVVRWLNPEETEAVRLKYGLQ